MKEEIEIPEEFLGPLAELAALPPSNIVLRRGMELGEINLECRGSLVFGSLQKTQISLHEVYLIYITKQPGLLFLNNVQRDTILPVTIKDFSSGEIYTIPKPVSVEFILPLINNFQFKKSILFNLDIFEE